MIDSHIHLTSEQYSEDLDEVIKNAKELGVEAVVLIGCDEEGIDKSRVLAKTDDFFFLAVGWHPVDASSFKGLDKIIDCIKNDNVVALGEMGLDYHWYPEEKEKQIEIFRKQIELAQAHNLPIIVHSRESNDDCLEILREYAPIKGVVHSFSGDGELAMEFIGIGMEIGISGPITFKNGHLQKDVARLVPLDKIHLETDGPYLTPMPFRGKRNRPEYIKYVAQEIARQKNIDVDIVIKQATINTKRLFNI